MAPAPHLVLQTMMPHLAVTTLVVSECRDSTRYNYRGVSIMLLSTFLFIVCSDGFTGMDCETNIDDCATDPCVNGTCTDLVGGYNCTCQAGFTGTNCSIDIDDCASNPCVNGTCMDLVNGYNCTCQAGFTGFNCVTNIVVCDSNPCVNGACVELVNGYNCTCPKEYTGTNCNIPGDVLTVTPYSVHSICCTSWVASVR